ncbi:MAG: hypothetical protein ACO1QR_15035 [Chthoniobacteraceae bacterium]
MKIKFIIPAAVAAALVLQGGIGLAQDEQGGRRGGDRGERGERGERRSPEEFRQRMNERLKESLKATDEEWSVIQPLIEKVTTKQREAAGNRFGGRGGRGGRGGDDNNSGQSQSASASASAALRATLQSESASPDEIKAKLTAVREARKNAAAEVDKAREELKAVLSVRQEAALVSMGILE